MSEVKHTPGPWFFDRDAVSGHRESDGKLIMIAKVETSPLCRERKIANAKLIAAAPDLLAAAEKMLAHLNARIDFAPDYAKPVFEGIAELHTAIAKARGEKE